ncbi:MAG: tetratricopeptide repeat protein, partial [Planctomycetes bacterium]|nr:tetratricopeptide repeat protein [Planctomycetota bacterium]
LYIMPADGGEPRRLRGNTPRMNSWHSWSPNGKWLAFSSKAYSPYTQLCLTHIDERGQSTPAVVLTNFTQAGTAVNIPEFVNAPPGAIKRIREEFLTEHHFYRAALHALRDNDFAAAERSYRKVLEFNASNVAATGELAAALFSQGKAEEAKTLFQKAIELEPDYAEAYVNLGNILVQEGNLSEAAEACREAVRLRPEDAVCQMMLGKVLMAAGGQYEEAMQHLDLAIRFNPRYADARKDLDLADAALDVGKLEEAARHYRSALEKWPKLALALMGLASIRATAADEDLRDGQEAIALATEACNETQFRHVRAMSLLAAAYAEAGKFQDAVYMAERALRLAQAVGSVKLEKKVRGELDLYRREKPLRRLGADDP